MIRLHSIRFAWPVLACLSATLPVWAQTDASTTAPSNSAYFQNATIVGTTNSISITDLPVTANGKTYYWNLTLPFEVSSNGDVMTGLLEETKSPIFLDSAFSAGTYAGPSTIFNGEMTIALEGPSVWNNAYTQWTISAASGAYTCTYPDNGAFYVVPALTDYPNWLYTRLKAVGITANGNYYGTGSSTLECNADYNWPPNGIIGVSQVGSTLKILSFSTWTNGKVVDHSSQVDEITYHKVSTSGQ